MMIIVMICDSDDHDDFGYQVDHYDNNNDDKRYHLNLAEVKTF